MLCSLMNTTLNEVLPHLHNISGNLSLVACTYPPEFNHTLCPSLYLSLICSLLPRLSFYPPPSLLRPLHSDDGSLLPEEKDRILRHPDLHAVLHDRHSVPGLLLAEPGVCPCEDGVWSVTTLLDPLCTPSKAAFPQFPLGILPALSSALNSFKVEQVDNAHQNGKQN